MFSGKIIQLFLCQPIEFLFVFYVEVGICQFKSYFVTEAFFCGSVLWLMWLVTEVFCDWNIVWLGGGVGGGEIACDQGVMKIGCEWRVLLLWCYVTVILGN